MLEFIQTIPFILPCKYCRHSLTCYYEKDPPAVQDRAHFTRWLWQIHNQVNNKLRAQNLNPSSNPSFESVRDFYKKWLKDHRSDNFSCYLPTFWDFLFAVAYNHPKETRHASKPMPKCPEAAISCRAPELERNKWNTLSYSVRREWYRKFWRLLPQVLGTSLSPAWQTAEKITGPNIKCRRTTLAWLWRMRCILDPNFTDPYTQICQKVSSFSSECSKSSRGKTCRRKRRDSGRITRKRGNYTQ